VLLVQHRRLSTLIVVFVCFRFFEYILLYKDAVMFQIEQVTKLCSKIALTEPWDPYDIPTNSTFEDQYYIGGPGDQIMVQEWSDRKPARKCMCMLLFNLNNHLLPGEK